MNLQYYELLPEKTKKNLLALCDYIRPRFSPKDLEFFAKDISEKPLSGTKGAKTEKYKGYIEIGADSKKEADLNKLSLQELKALYQILISRELNTKKAIKWRFYHYFKYINKFVVEQMFILKKSPQDHAVDFIIKTDDSKIFFVIITEILDQKIYGKVLDVVTETIKQLKVNPDKVYIATNKTYRNISLDNAIIAMDEEIFPELWLEWNDYNCPFNGDDLIVVGESDLQLAGFNFTSMDDALEYIYKNIDGGQIYVYKKSEFFTDSKNTNELELIWKGIMIK